MTDKWDINDILKASEKKIEITQSNTNANRFDVWLNDEHVGSIRKSIDLFQKWMGSYNLAKQSRCFL